MSEELFNELRAKGHAVVVFTPDELNGAEPEWVEAAMVKAAWETIHRREALEAKKAALKELRQLSTSDRLKGIDDYDLFQHILVRKELRGQLEEEFGVRGAT